MSDPYAGHNSGPVFNHPEGASPYPEEETLPLVDLYPQSDSGGGAFPYGSNEGSWNQGSYGAEYQAGGQYPPQQYASQQYQQGSLYGPNPQPHPMAVPPQQQQAYGYYGYGAMEHPQSTTVLVLALVGFAVPVTAFIAWYMGNKAKGEISRGAPFPYSGSLKVGHIIGKVLSIISIAGVALYGVIMILYFIFIGALLASF